MKMTVTILITPDESAIYQIEFKNDNFDAVVETVGKCSSVADLKAQKLWTVVGGPGKLEAEQVVIDHCAERGVKVTNQDLADWYIIGDETDAELIQYANDYLSDVHTENCESKNAWRYSN